MKLVHWQFMNLSVPMMEDETGELYCTSKTLCITLAVTEASLRQISSRHAEEFSELSVTNRHAKQFLQDNKYELGIKRVRGDARLWSDSDMILFAILSKSPRSLGFRKDLVQFIRKNAVRGYVSIAQHEALAASLRADQARTEEKLSAVMDVIQQYLPTADKTASFAGSMLRAQRDTKALRSIH